MTYAETEELFQRYNRASTWPTKGPRGPRLFHFHRDGGEERTVDLQEDDGRARYLRVPLNEVYDHVERAGGDDSKNVYYRLRSRGRG
jgi:hypothetical protein